MSSDLSTVGKNEFAKMQKPTAYISTYEIVVLLHVHTRSITNIFSCHVVFVAI